MGEATYSPATVARMTGVSINGVRNYSNRAELAEFFSDGARPGPGEARAFTAEDVRLVAFIRDRTDQGFTVAQVAEALAAGELEEFRHWSPPEPRTAPAEDDSTAITTGDQAQALAVFEKMITDLRSQAAQERARADQLAQEVRSERARADRYRDDVQATIETYEEARAELREELGRLRGQLEEIKAARQRRPAWVRWLTGG